jgi:hypothetical protein
VAQASWAGEYQSGRWVPVPIQEAQLRRTAKSALRDPRALPFLRDLLDMAVRRAGSGDLLVFTNDDCVFAPGLTDTLLRVESACWSSRHEFVRLPKPPSCLDIITARKHPGADLFCLSPRWWQANRRDMPDMLLGVEAVDLVLRKLMLATGGIELHAAVGHEEHASYWLTHRADPAAVHNRKLAGAWLAKRGLTWD